MRATQPKGEEGKLGLEEYAGGVGPQPRHFQHSFHTSLRDENWSERKTVQTAGQRGPNGGLGQLLNTQVVILLTAPSEPIRS